MTVKRCAVERAYDSRQLVVRTAITQHGREGKIRVSQTGAPIQVKTDQRTEDGEFVSGMSKLR
jgi:hypothetical protein